MKTGEWSVFIGAKCTWLGLNDNDHVAKFEEGFEHLAPEVVRALNTAPKLLTAAETFVAFPHSPSTYKRAVEGLKAAIEEATA